jgi:outer membrane protein assembly factor BamB
MGFNPPPGWPVPHGWNPPPNWVPDPSWPPAPPGWQFWTEDWTGGPEAEDAPQSAARGRRPITLIAVIVLVVGAALGGGYLLIDRLTVGDNDGSGGPVAGQLRGTFPENPTVGWRLDGDTVFDLAEFVRPDRTANVYSVPGFIDLGDTLVTSAILPQTDRPATLVGIDAESGAVRWTAHVGFKPVCATATVDGLLPCVGEEVVFGADSGPPPKVSFVRMSDGAIDHQIAVSEHVGAVEVHDSAVYTMASDYGQMVRTITRGTADDLEADWIRTYPLTEDGAGCPASGDTLIDGVDGDIVYTGNDGGLAVASASDGDPLTQRQMVDLKVFGAQGFTARVCHPQDPSVVTTSVVDTEGHTLRTVEGTKRVADPWLVEPSAELPYIIGPTAYNFASGEELWTASGSDLHLHTVVGDTVLGDLNGGKLAAFDLKTGEQLWTSRHRVHRPELSDGQRIMVTTDAGLVAVDLATGEDLWTLSGVKSWSVSPAGSGFAHAVPESITFYPPTGGPSVAPGRVDTSSSDADESGGLITKCGRTPEMRPVEYRAGNGSLLVKMEVKARCPGGDIVSTDRLRVTIRDNSGLICTGVFDFSQDPLAIGGEGSEPTTLELDFGPGTFSRHPNTLGEHSGQPAGPGEIITQSKASGAELVDCEDEGTSGGPQSADSATGQAQVKSRPDQPGGPVSGCGSDGDALAALRTQVDADRPFVQAQLVDRWVAQLSSKRPGLVAPDVDGRMVTWTPCEILQQHLRMRGQYPEVRLVWSDEWRTFDLAGWWVTVAGVTFPDADAANGWCGARAIPVDECYAKVISNTNDSGRTTKYRR